MKTTVKNIFIILLTALLITCAGSPKADYGDIGSAADKVPLTSAAITGTLPNGLKYFILENARPENRAHLALVVNAGSVLETDDQRGFAHFTEHMSFKGTTRFPEMDLINYLRSLGMRFGPDANAYTSYNETVYSFDVPVETAGGKKSIPDKALAILDDWTYAVSFNPQDVASESLVVLEEMRSRLGAMDRVRKITLPILFEGSAYADRQPIGLSEIIEGATAEKLKSFYDRWYTSDNMTLVFVGDFDGKALQADLANHFNMKAADKPVNRPYHELPPPKSGNFKVEIITDAELTSSSYMIYYKQKPGAPRGTIGYYRETIVDYLIDTMLSERFEERETDPEAKAMNAWGGVWRWAKDSRFYTMGTSSKTGSAEAALKELLFEKEAMRRHGFTQNELDRAKVNLMSYMEQQVSEKDKRDSRSFIRNFTSHILYGEDMADIEWELDFVFTMLPGITLKEVSSAAKKYFSYNDCIVFLLAPEAEAQSLPSPQRIKAIFSEAEKLSIAPRKSETVSNELLDTVPQGGTITNEAADRQTGSLTLTLSNGAKVILRETKNKNNEIVMYAMARGGTFNAPAETDISVSLLDEMLAVSGLGPYSRIQLIQKLAGKQVYSSFWSSGYYRGFQGASTSKDLKTLVEMIYIFFTQPKFDERAVAAMIDQYKTSLMHQEEDPQKYFSRELTKIISNNHPRFKPLEASDMDKVSLAEAFDFLKLCLNPADYTFVFTGNINVNEMKELCSKYIASIPNSSSLNSWVDPRVVRPRRTDRTLYKGQDEKCTVYLAWFAGGPSDFSENRNQVAAVLTEYLDILLNDEIREKMSGVYSIGSGASVSVIPKGEYSLSVYFQCSPERSSELISAVNDIINKVSQQPVNQDVFNKAKEALIKQHENSIQRNLHIAQSFANSAVLYSTPLSSLNDRPAAVRAVRPENIQVLCREMIVQGPVQVVLYPEDW
jgi:zinc protease